MRRKVIYIVFLMFTGISIFAQVGINTNNSLPDQSAILDVSSTTKGFLPPRMTFQQRNSIVSPAEGLVVICTNGNIDGTGVMSMYLSGQWLNITGSCALPVTPVAGNPVISNTQITWNWSPVAIATGYKWNTVNNFATATDMGSSTSKTESGLTAGTSYTRYVWAYNPCGTTAPVILVAQALVCGSSFVVNHIGGYAAPESKTVNYPTVTGIPGEPTKCWITQNLGASQQATAVNDATETSAGWYWQFNRLQGYKHDGTTRTPNTPWNSSISEAGDWNSSGDPCTIELGSAWRMPTSTEWNNVRTAGGWTTWNDTWSSALKLHAAGYLYYTTGSLSNRGTQGNFWSSTNSILTEGKSFYMNNLFASMSSANKSAGFSLRCIRN